MLFFTVTGWFFWVILFVVLALSGTFLFNRKGWGVFFTLLCGITLMAFLGMFDFPSFMKEIGASPLAVLRAVGTAVGAYLLIGIPYLFVRFAFFIRRTKRDEYRALKRPFLLPNGALDPARRDQWISEIRRHEDFVYDEQNDTVTVRVSRFKGRMAEWWSLWIIDIFAFVFGDLLGEFFRGIWKVIKNLLQHMANGLMRGA